MNFINQFIASVTFKVKTVIHFASQSIWKSVFYTIMIVLIAGVISSIFYTTALPSEVAAFRIFYHYIRITIDLIIHFIFISAIAFAGRSYGKLLDLTYSQVWTITAYGITAPIVIRTLIQILGIPFPATGFIYWVVVAFFSMFALK